MTGSLIRQLLNRPLFRAGLLAASAAAGYCAFLPAAQTTSQSTAQQIDAHWAGSIEPQTAVVAAPMTPVTSASYTQTEVKAGSPSTPAAEIKKIGAITAAKSTKPADVAAVRPARRPDDLASAKPAKTAAAETIALELDQSIGQPAKRESFSRRWLAPVSDRLPSRGTLMKPLHLVGDAVSGLMNAF